MNVEVSGHNLESSSDLKIPYADQFQTSSAQRGGGVKSSVEVTVNSKEEIS